MKHYVLMLLVAVGLLSSCGFSESKTGEIQYYPYKESKSGNWGLIGMDGKPLFREKFTRAITVAKDGRFFAKNAGDTWNLYTATAEPEKIGEPYVSVGVFDNGVAPVVRPNSPIEFIDTDGKVVFTFDKVNDKMVTCMSNFQNGVATFTISGGYKGAVNTKGKVVLEPNYTFVRVAGERLIAVEGVSAEEYRSSSNGDSLLLYQGTISVFTLDGEKQWSIDASMHQDKVGLLSFIGRNEFHDGKAIFSSGSGDSRMTGIINDKGEWVVDPKSNTQDIYYFKDEKFIYSNGTPLKGMMDYAGNTILRESYFTLRFSNVKGVLIANSLDGLNLIDEDGNTLGGNKYKSISDFLKDGLAFAQKEEGDYVMIDAKGTEHKPEVTIAEWGESQGDDVIESDVLDLEAFVEELRITPMGLGAFSLTQTADEIPFISMVYGSPIEKTLGSTVVKGYGRENNKQTVITSVVSESTSHIRKGFAIFIVGSEKLKGKFPALMALIKAKCESQGLQVMRENQYFLSGRFGEHGLLVEYTTDEKSMMIVFQETYRDCFIAEYLGIDPTIL